MAHVSRRSIALAAVVAVAATGLTLAQDKFAKQAQRGPYRVFVSKPIVGLSYTAGELYREHEYLGAMLNALDAEGLVPVHTLVTTQTLEGRDDEDRLLVVCVPK